MTLGAHGEAENKHGLESTDSAHVGADISLAEDLNSSCACFEAKGTSNCASNSLQAKAVETIPHFKYLGVQITEDLTWSTHTKMVVRKAQQCLYYLHCLRKFRLLFRILTSFYRRTIKKHPDRQHHCVVRKTLKRVVQSAERTTGGHLADLRDIYIWQCRKKAKKTNQGV